MHALREKIHLPAGQSFRVLRWSRDLSEVEVVTAGGKSAKTAGVGCLALGADRLFDKSTEIDALIDYCERLADGTDSPPAGLSG